MKRFLIAMTSAFAIMTAPVFAQAEYSTDATTIGDLVDNPDTRAILDKHLPGLSENEQLAMARGMTLRFVAPMSNGEISEEAMDAIDADLAALPADEPAAE